MVLILFLSVLPLIMFIDDEFLKVILIALWCVLVTIMFCVFMYLDRESKDNDGDE